MCVQCLGLCLVSTVSNHCQYQCAPTQSRITWKWSRMDTQNLMVQFGKLIFLSEKLEAQMSAVTLRCCVILSKLLPLSDL